MNVQQQVPGVGTSSGPAWAISGGEILLAWKGEGTDARIFWSTTSALDPDPNSQQYKWSAQSVVPNAATSASPALANFKGAVYLAWKGESGDQRIFWSKTTDGKTWSPQEPVPGVGGTSDGPALAAFGDAMYLAWKAGAGDQRIFWSKSSDGVTWSSQEPVPGVGGTSCSPALAAPMSGGMYLAWKAGVGDERIFWSKTADGKTWSPQQPVPGALTSFGPTLAGDVGGDLRLAWRADNGNIFFSTLPVPMLNTIWNPPTVRYGVATSDRPALLSSGLTPQGVAPLMLAWKGAGTDPDIWYGPLYLPQQALDVALPSFQILNMRSGSVWGKTESDTDYVGFGLKIVGQPPQVLTKFVGDQTGGNVSVGLSFSNVKVWDTDRVILTYYVVNSSKGDETIAFLANATTTLLNAAEKADEAAINELTGVDLSSLTPTEAGVLIGAQIGTALVPVVGTALGALAGWLFSIAPWGSLWPDCDGPVAAGIHVFSGASLRAQLAKGAIAGADDNPGVNSQGGCGSNSHYVVDWNITAN